MNEPLEALGDPESELVDSLRRPANTLGHELRGHIHALMASVAVIRSEVRHGHVQGERIEGKLDKIQERMDQMGDRVTKLEQQFGPVQKLSEIVDALVREVGALQHEFMPIRNIVYGLIVLMCTGVIGAILALVLKQ